MNMLMKMVDLFPLQGFILARRATALAVAWFKTNDFSRWSFSKLAIGPTHGLSVRRSFQDLLANSSPGYFSIIPYDWASAWVRLFSLGSGLQPKRRLSAAQKQFIVVIPCTFSARWLSSERRYLPMRKISIMVLFITALMLYGTPCFSADGDENSFGQTVIINATDYATEADLSDAVDALLADPTVERIRVLDNVAEISEPGVTEGNIILYDTPIITYFVNNVRNKPDSLSGVEFTAVGDKGTRVALSKTYSKSSSASGTFGANNGIISAGVGWNVSASFSVSGSNSWYVPYTDDNGRSVARGKLEMRTVYQVKSYDVYAVTSTGTSYRGTGTAKKPLGVDFKKVFIY
jgi:hypothetical protein